MSLVTSGSEVKVALQCKHVGHEVILVITLACMTVTMSATRQD